MSSTAERAWQLFRDAAANTQGGYGFDAVHYAKVAFERAKKFEEVEAEQTKPAPAASRKKTA